MAKAFKLTPVIVDSGIIYALMDRTDAWHQRVSDYLQDFIGKLIVPITVVPEACYLLNNFLGPAAERAFLSSLTNGEFVIEPCSPADLSRCLTILERYADANLGLVDASVMAIAERLRITKILTCDRRHFSLVRPKHCTGFELCP